MKIDKQNNLMTKKSGEEILTEIKTDKVENATLEPSLANLLKDRQLLILKNAVIKAGIHTLDEFKKLNLWVFMNQNGLYSIGDRQKIFSEIRRILTFEKGSNSESEVKWKIITCKNEYIGTSPASALIIYCRHMADRFPLRFRSLIGQRISPLNTIPLSRTWLRTGDLHMDNPEAYINSGMGPIDVLISSKWIGKMCSDSDMPQKIVFVSSDETIEYNDRGECSKIEHTKSTKTGASDIQGADDRKESGKTNQAKLPEADTPGAPDNEKKENGVDAKGKTLVETHDSSMPDVNSAREGQSGRQLIISPLQSQVEQLILKEDIPGATPEQLYAKFPMVTMVALRRICNESTKIVEIADRFVHIDAIEGWDTAAVDLEEILEKLMKKYNGYISAALLYRYVRAEMQMFLNDNDLDDQRKVFDITEYLITKERHEEKHYHFIAKTHISCGDNTVASNMDVFKKYASDHNGFFRYDDLVEYLKQIGINTGNLRGQLFSGMKPNFFYYSIEEIISVESMKIDKSWLLKAERAFQCLFEDMGDHVVFRTINPIWYEQLPALPGNRSWTPLLLQCVLQSYGKKIGAKTVGAERTQKYSVLHAMIVAAGSEIQTFADAVVAYLIDSDIQERQFRVKELHRTLVTGGLISQNELTGNLKGAIGSDPRFAWDASGETVRIKV